MERWNVSDPQTAVLLAQITWDGEKLLIRPQVSDFSETALAHYDEILDFSRATDILRRDIQKCPEGFGIGQDPILFTYEAANFCIRTLSFAIARLEILPPKAERTGVTHSVQIEIKNGDELLATLAIHGTLDPKGYSGHRVSIESKVENVIVPA